MYQEVFQVNTGRNEYNKCRRHHHDEAETGVRDPSSVATPLQLFLLGAFFRFDGLRRYRRMLTAVTLVKLVVTPAN